MGLERGSNFFAAFLFLSAPQREALSAVYAYCRTIDDIVDSGSLPKDQARKMLSFWRSEITRLFAGTPTHSISRSLAAALKSFPLPQEALLEMIRGCEMDLNGTVFKTYEELESYMDGVAGSVGRLSVEIFGYKHTTREGILEFARKFGHAFQLTNIIRDVGADLELGRVYLPEEDMKEAGYTREELIRRVHNPAFQALMQKEYARAAGLYRQARAAVDFRDRPGLLPAEIMAHIYEGLLEDIREGGFRVLFHQERLPGWKKARLAFRAWMYCHGF